MADWKEELSPIVREKLARIGELTPEEKGRTKELERLNSLLTHFYKGFLNAGDLYQRLKEFQEQGKQFLLKEAQARLESSFKRKKVPLRFEQGSDGTLTVKFLEEKEIEEKAEDLVLELSSDNFDEAINKHPLLVIDCWAPWCAPCRMVAPVIEELARDYQGKITFGKLNIDENPTIAMRYQIMSIPTLLIFKNGQLVEQKIGAMPRTVLEPELARYTESEDEKETS
ncbi:MAG: thioredoxin [Dehalococcoidia bacterium]|nr:thioredoxin [Dehalococcoidia bacterium]